MFHGKDLSDEQRGLIDKEINKLLNVSEYDSEYVGVAIITFFDFLQKVGCWKFYFGGQRESPCKGLNWTEGFARAYFKIWMHHSNLQRL